jgi:hypothetical protein
MAGRRGGPRFEHARHPGERSVSPEEAWHMSTVNPPRGARSADYAPGGEVREYVEEDSGYGWVLFAGTMLAILATLNFIDGVAAVSNSTFFTENAKFVLSDLNTWGWVLIATSAIQLGLAFGIWAKVKGLRWFGVAIASVNAIIQLVFMPAYPFWSLCLFTLDILVIYGLIAHGARTRPTT